MCVGMGMGMGVSIGTALATAPLWHTRGPPAALHHRTQTGALLVAVRRHRRVTGAVAVRVADVAVWARAAHLLHRQAGGGDGGEQGEGERPLALEDAFGGAQFGRGAAVGARKTTACMSTPDDVTGTAASTVAVGSTINDTRLIPDGLDLVPLQLEQPLKVSLQVVRGLGPGYAFALCVEEDGQLLQAPAIEGRGQEVWVAAARLALAAEGGGGGGTGTPLELSRINHLKVKVKVSFSDSFSGFSGFRNWIQNLQSSSKTGQTDCIITVN